MNHAALHAQIAVSMLFNQVSRFSGQLKASFEPIWSGFIDEATSRRRARNEMEIFLYVDFCVICYYLENPSYR